jgi:hypothetical protein
MRGRSPVRVLNSNQNSCFPLEKLYNRLYKHMDAIPIGVPRPIWVLSLLK